MRKKLPKSGRRSTSNLRTTKQEQSRNLLVRKLRKARLIRSKRLSTIWKTFRLKTVSFLLLFLKKRTPTLIQNLKAILRRRRSRSLRSRSRYHRSICLLNGRKCSNRNRGNGAKSTITLQTCAQWVSQTILSNT